MLFKTVIAAICMITVYSGLQQVSASPAIKIQVHIADEQVKPLLIEYDHVNYDIVIEPVDYDDYISLNATLYNNWFIESFVHYTVWYNGTGDIELTGGEHGDDHFIIKWIIPAYVGAETIINATLFHETEIPKTTIIDAEIEPVLLHSSERVQIHKSGAGDVNEDVQLYSE